MKRIAFFTLLFVLLTGLTTAQMRTGNIMGQVALEDGSIIPGVTITLTSPQIGTLVSVSSENGNYRFLSLPPGKDYEIAFELEGFKRVTRKGIRIAVGENITVNALMVMGLVSEEVEVTARPSIIDTRKTTTSVNISQEALKSLPTARDPWSVLEMVPGIMMDRQNVGGNESGQQSSFSSRGEGRANTQWNVDGVDVTDPTAPGTSGMYYDFEMFEEMQIQTAANDVTAMTGGVNINFVTKRGTNDLHGGAQLFWTGDALQSVNLPESLERQDLSGNLIDHNTDFGINLGGPLLKDKIWFWGSYGIQNINLLDTLGDSDKTLLRTINAKFNFHLGNHRIELYSVYNDKIKEGRKRYALDLYEASRKQTGPAYIFKLQDEISLSTSSLLSLKVAYTPTSYQLEPYGGRDVPVYEEYRQYRWNTGTWEEYNTDVFSASIQYDHFLERFLGSDHEIKLGADFRSSMSKTGSQVGNGLQLITVGGEGYYARVYREWKLDYITQRFSAFLQDTISLNRLTLMLGLRYDRQKIGTKDITIPGTSIAAVRDVGGRDYNWPQASQTGIDFPSTFDFISPRLGLSWDISGSGRSVIKANWAIYGSVLDSGYLGNFQVDSYHDFDWYDDGDLKLQANELDLYKTIDNYKSLTTLDPTFFFTEGLKPEKDMEFLLGFEQQLHQDMKVGVNLIYRRKYDLNWSVPYVYDRNLKTMRLVRPEDWSSYTATVNGQTYTYWDSYDARVYNEGVSQLQLRPDYAVEYKALELTFKKEFANNWMMSASATFQDTIVNYESRNSYIDPTDHSPTDFLNGFSGPHSLGRTVMNSRWMAKLNWMTVLPLNIHFSGKVSAREGYIFPKVSTLQGEPRRYWDNVKPTVLLEEFGKSRYPDFFQIDLRLDKSIKLGNLGLITFSFEGFNITNSNVALQKGNDVSLSNFNIATIILNPRIFRLGMRYEF